MICFIVLLLYSLDKVFVSFPLVMLWYFYLSVFLRYTLFAVVNHSGTLEVGHYTCFIRQQQQVCSLIASRCFTIIFNRNLVIRDCIGLLLLRSVIGSENSLHSQPIEWRNETNHDLVARVSRALGSFLVLTLSSHWP